MYLTGVLQVLGIVVLSSLFNIFIRVVSLHTTLNPIIFTICTFLSASMILCFLGGPGKLVRGTLFSFKTWLYGIALSITVAIDIYLVKYVSGTEAGLFCRGAVPICFILSTIILKRNIKHSDLFSIITTFIGLLYLIYIQNTNIQLTLTILTIILGIALSITVLIPETHKENAFAQELGSLHMKLRVIGFAMFSTTIIISIATLLITFFKSNFISISTLNIPGLEIFKSYQSIIAGSIGGIVFSSPILYLKWSASYKINAESVLIIMSLVPITTLITEYSLSFFPIFDINMSTFTNGHGLKVLLIVFIITIGSGLSAYLKTYQRIQESEGNNLWEKFENSTKIESEVLAIQYKADSLADYEVIKNTVDFYEGDLKKASNILEIPLDTLKLLFYSKNNYSLREDVSKKVHKIFRNKIFYLDQLTGIENKKGLIKKYSELQSQNSEFNLYYLDLNKFKKINDTLGHYTGDLALITVAQRLKKYALENSGFTYRLGGDEFAFLTTSEKAPHETITEIKELISQPFQVKSENKDLNLTLETSIGKANIIKDDETKIKDLISSADKEMYLNKKS